MRETRLERRAGSAAALLGTAVGLLVAAAVATVWARFPFPVIAVAERVAGLTPGGVATFAIELLQKMALPLTVVLTALGVAFVTAALGRALPRVARSVGSTGGAAALLAIPLVLAGALAFDPSGASVGRAGYVVVLIVCAVVGAAVTAEAYGRLLAGAAAEPHDATRRTLLRAAWLGAAALALGWLHLGSRWFGGRGMQARPLRARVVIREPAPVPDPGFEAIDGLAPLVTSNEAHYVVDEEIVDPAVDAERWALSVDGRVDAPYELGYDALLGLPAEERVATLECISNPVGGDLIGNAAWTGVPVSELLDRAGLAPDALEVVFRAVGGYSDSLPIDHAMRPDVVIAIGMNGMVLPREHGFPARLIAPGYYGMKQPKWLESIEVVSEPHVGYWERRGWIKAAVVKTMSRIDTVAATGVGQVVAGVAFAGDRGIEQVEVSLDGGTTWREAELERAISERTWRRWNLSFEPDDASTITVRATDGSGARQSADVVPPHPSGSTGYHGVEP